MTNASPCARTSTWLAAAAILAFAISAQLGVLDAATMTVIFACWAAGSAWLVGGPSRRARLRARMVTFAARGQQAIEAVDVDSEPRGELRVPLNDLLREPEVTLNDGNNRATGHAHG